MKQQSIVSEEYVRLHEAIIHKQSDYKEKIQNTVTLSEREMNQSNSPIAYQIDWKIDGAIMLAIINEMAEILAEFQPKVTDDLEAIKLFLDAEKADKWVHEAYIMNHFYFEEIEKAHGLPAWLTNFLAEVSARPVFQVIAKRYEGSMNLTEAHDACPCCGEPPRLGVLGKNKRKMLVCPRCHTTWENKKTVCTYCGAEEQVKVIKIEERETEQIHVCDECNGYTKVINTARMLSKDDPALLDVKTLHLDYIAQQKGYSLDRNKQTLA